MIAEQLQIGGVSLPISSNDKYSCWEEPLVVSVDMISGRRVQELRGKVWHASYSFDRLNNDTLRSVLSVLRSGEPFQAFILPDTQDEMIAGTFVLESITPPTFAFLQNGSSVWHNLAFQIREEAPHD